MTTARKTSWRAEDGMPWARRTLSAWRVCEHDVITPWMCSAIDRQLVIVTRILSVVRRVIPGRGGGWVMVRLLFLSAKMTSSVLARLSVRLLCLDHESICSSSVVTRSKCHWLTLHATVLQDALVVTMTVFVAVGEIFSVIERCNLENRVNVRSRSLEIIPVDRSHTSSY